MKNHPLGFDSEQKLVVGMDLQVTNSENCQTIKTELSNHHTIKNATFSSSVPGRWMYYWRVFPSGQEAEKNLAMNFFQADYDFIPNYKISLVAGRSFDREIANDGAGLVINEAAVKMFGWNSPDEAIGKNIWNERVSVIGVVKNFHFRGLQSEVNPLGILLIEDDYKYLTLTINTEEASETVKFLEEKYKGLFPQSGFEFFFLDEDFDKQYRFEVNLSKIFSIFTSVGILVACLGLFGLAAFVAEQRTKEIGIRKVLGASVPNIIRLLTSEFVLLITLANLIAAPIAWFALDEWLENFVYRVEIDPLVFLIAGLSALSIALLTVSFQSIRAANADPSKSLRYE
jgi:putative ABC transport system permease protein